MKTVFHLTNSKFCVAFVVFAVIFQICIFAAISQNVGQSPIAKTDPTPDAVAEQPALNVPCITGCPSTSDSLDIATSDRKAFGDKRYFWHKHDLSIKFMDGDTTLQNRVAKIAVQWTQFANIAFHFDNSSDADIRISFAGKGHWSRIGSDSRNAAKNSPSMNLQVDDQTSDSELSRVVLHEFGHALGLMHEHRQPGNPIKWNKEVVEAWYEGAPNYWSKNMIEEQVFAPYNSPTTVSNGYHPDSIMHYPILKGWTTDGFTVGWNKELVQSDKDFIAKCYPPKN